MNCQKQEKAPMWKINSKSNLENFLKLMVVFQSCKFNVEYLNWLFSARTYVIDIHSNKKGRNYKGWISDFVP